VAQNPAKATDVDPRLPLESFAYWSIDGANRVNNASAKIASIEVKLPLESFTYWSIDGTNSVTHNSAEVADTRSYTENTARNFVDYHNGEYAGMLTYSYTENTTRNFVDFHNGEYAG
jgi:hypothetical protein